MKKILFKLIGKIYSPYLRLDYNSIFKEKRNRKHLQEFAESEVKNVFFKIHARFKGYRLINNYVDTKKKSDTVFIIGSGESINELSRKDWNWIKKNNIIGLNYSFVHPVIPDYHLMEMIPLKDMQKFFCENTKERYMNVDIFFQYKHVLKSGFDIKKYPYIRRVMVHVPHLYPTSSPNVLKSLFNNLKKKNDVVLSHLVHHNSHIGCAVMFAQALGYKNIVMLGIDLNGGSYFTDSHIISSEFPYNEDYETINRLRKRHFDNVKEFQNSIHPTMDKALMSERSGLMMAEYFKVYKEVFIDNSSCNLYIGSEKSRLSKILPVYEFEN